MLESVMLLAFIAAIAVWYFLPSFSKSKSAEHSVYLEKLKVPEDSVLKRHFLTHLKSEIEAARNACPTDPTLRHHYNTLAEHGLK